jgi:hypothetical protein
MYLGYQGRENSTGGIALGISFRRGGYPPPGANFIPRCCILMGELYTEQYPIPATVFNENIADRKENSKGEPILQETSFVCKEYFKTSKTWKMSFSLNDAKGEEQPLFEGRGHRSICAVCFWPLRQLLQGYGSNIDGSGDILQRRHYTARLIFIEII